MTGFFRRAVGGLFAALLCSGPVGAQTLPASFMVRDVPAGDVLNIRAEPSSDATIVGEIGPYAINVEVIEVSGDGKWGRVSTGEGNGWVALRYLEQTPIMDPARLPRPMTCMGTEPFWSLGLFDQGAEWTTPDTPRTDLTELDQAVAPTGFFLRAEDGPERVYSLTITRESCSDGMSDRAFGFSARLFVESPDGNMLASGCCTMDLR